MDKMQQRLEQVTDATTYTAGYGSAAGLTTTPFWYDPTILLHNVGLVIGILVGITTLYINYLKIKRERNRGE